MKQIFIHPYAGVLSAYGMGLADVRVIKEKSVEEVLNEELVGRLKEVFEELEGEAQEGLLTDGFAGKMPAPLMVFCKVRLRYEGTDSALIVDFGDVGEMVGDFEEAHRQRYGFVMEKNLIVEAISVEVVAKNDVPDEGIISRSNDALPAPVSSVQMYSGGMWQEVPVFQRNELQPGDKISGPTIIIESTGTNVIEAGWEAELTARNYLILNRRCIAGKMPAPQMNADESIRVHQRPSAVNKSDAVMLEIFNNLFRSIAEQMGITLQNTSSSVNIKERLDFSCAIFDQNGGLVANAPHIPVHLGSMSESVKALISAHQNNIKPGDVYVSNNPYNGGTHLPDITVITPVFSTHKSMSRQSVIAGKMPAPLNSTFGTEQILFYVASRGHHADIGGITPGSMPPNSTTVEQEGILLDNFLLVQTGNFRQKELLDILNSGKYPARNTTQNLADLQAQIAANERGVQELLKMVEHYGIETVQAYMGFVQDNAEESVRRIIEVLNDGEFSYPMDNGGEIKVKITIDKTSRSAKVDFTGTSPQLNSNFNAPAAVCKAAVLYVFRTLVDDDIPLNAGCLKPLEIIIPEGCMLNPVYPAAVVAGNVETSQNITDALYCALGVMAASQGTMNNVTFGNERYQYYETICGGSGAGFGFNGTDGVHTHMTNSRLTDPEVLEWRFPVLLTYFGIRENSGGKGQFSGGNGVVRSVQFLEKMTAGILSGRRIIPPFGLNGGGAGAVGKNYVVRENGCVEELGSTAVVDMNAGDVFVIETPGGGAFG